jgi:hypothetical protein
MIDLRFNSNVTKYLWSPNDRSRMNITVLIFFDVNLYCANCLMGVGLRRADTCRGKLKWRGERGIKLDE